MYVLSSFVFGVHRHSECGQAKPPDLQTYFGKLRSRNLFEPLAFFAAGLLTWLVFKHKYFMLTLTSRCPAAFVHCGFNGHPSQLTHR
ncbi:hypothetical protein QFZ78_002973 [Paenibacillus sp. V4I5]|nr:hypothetical protein [Paenibacillus sp. V4I5]